MKKQKKPERREISAEEYKREIFGFWFAPHVSERERAEISDQLKEVAALADPSAPRFVVVKHRFFVYDPRERLFKQEEEATTIRGLLVDKELHVRAHSFYKFGSGFSVSERCEGVPDWASADLVALARKLLRR